jgi:hypothetical protein
MIRLFFGLLLIPLLASLVLLSPFEHIVERVIKIWGLQDSVGDLNEQQATRARLEVALFLGNVAVTAIAGAAVYVVVVMAQNKNTKTTLNIERLNTLHFLEKDIENIFHEKSVLIRPEHSDSNRYVEYMSLFRDNWKIPAHKKPTLIGQERMFDVGNDGELVASRSIYKTLNWFRRIERAHKANVVRSSDIAALWRQIIPFTVQNRYSVFCEIFSKKDVESIHNVGLIAWEQLYKSGKKQNIKEMRKQIDPAFSLKAPRRLSIRRKNELVAAERV